MKVDKERLVQKIRPTIAYAFLSNFKYLLLLLLAALSGQLFHPYSFLLMIVFFAVFFWKIMQVVTLSYYLYEEVLIVKSGIINVKFDALELFRVKDYRVTQNGMERILGLMSLTLYTTDISSPTLILRGIEVSDIPNKIRDFVQSSRIKNRIFEIN